MAEFCDLNVVLAVYPRYAPPPRHTQGFFSIRGATADHYRICDLKWQGFGVTSPTAAPLALPSEEATAAATARVEWTPEDNARLTTQMVRALEASGALVDDWEEQQGGVGPQKGPKKEAEASLAKTLREGIAAHTKPTTTIDAAADGGGKLSPALGHLAEEFGSVDALAAALAAKARGQGEGPQQQQQQQVGADALRDAVAGAMFQVGLCACNVCVLERAYILINPPI